MLPTFFAAFFGAAAAALGTELIRARVRKGQSVEEKRDCFLSELTDTIEELKECAIKFWSIDADKLGDEFLPLQANILGQQHHVSQCIATLFTGPSKHDCDIAAGKFFEAVSSYDFNDPSRKTSKDALQKIHATSKSLRLIVLKCRNELPRPALS